MQWICPASLDHFLSFRRALAECHFWRDVMIMVAGRTECDEFLIRDFYLLTLFYGIEFSLVSLQVLLMDFSKGLLSWMYSRVSISLSS